MARRSSRSGRSSSKSPSAWRTSTRWQTLKQKIQIPLATGECLYTKFDFRQILNKQAADIIQPDICLAGGIMELKKIAGMAEAHYVKVAPHNPMGPLATMVNVHFAASTPNFLILEYHPDDANLHVKI